MSDTIVNVEGLNVSFGSAHVLKDVSLSVDRSRTVGVVGESGSGKSTLAKAMVGLVRPSSGQVWVDGIDVATASRRELAAYRRRVQMIPQDPFSSLSPRQTVGQALAEAVDPRRARVGRHRDLIAHWLEQVGLPADAMHRYPYEFSGGQRQRVAIARGLVIEPSLVIADEITSRSTCPSRPRSSSSSRRSSSRSA
ncbi:ATP-binding cassette domain-containing protein [Cellulosimicrobium sp. CUA-896]|uniref:ATP-binding cassette domain-containing protein n=1 Tax=Cellulosimicrobium sp. CUA-896 TaxID=1517881 RepID=UPI000ADD2DE1|nr:dipeptide/oligopeptide/nickel ABC transporter ATP-binding protein [Cellulosimicrobium sp. CUA-896]